MNQFLINTPCGQICGVAGKDENTIAYKGIRYATAARWEYPKQVTAWEGVYQATEFGNCSWQPRAFYDEAVASEKAFYYNEFRKGEQYTYSDDCLFLNIWVPKTAQNCPVLFYIHGGGFTGGCGHEKHFSGEGYCKENVILVTINYRLGPMGFCALPALANEAGHTGNYGLFDQLTALQWVNDNIAAFGGDASRITIMGQSAGAMSVQQLCVSPLSDGLFASAIMHSGGGCMKGGKQKTTQETYPFWQAVMEECGCDSLAAFRAVDTAVLFAAFKKVKSEGLKAISNTGPTIDGVYLTQSSAQALASGTQKKVPYLMCSNSEDMLCALMYHMARRWAAAQPVESYMGFFARQLPGDKKGAWHSAELWYAFGTLANGWRPFTSWDKTLSDSMLRYYTNFIKTGNPNGEGLAPWLPARQSQDFCFGDTEIGMKKTSRMKLMVTTLTTKPVGE